MCGSYSPISLLNVDLKVFAKILATRIQPHLTKLIHPKRRQKAFDHVNWYFMFAVLCHVELGDRMVRWISSIY